MITPTHAFRPEARQLGPRPNPDETIRCILSTTFLMEDDKGGDEKVLSVPAGDPLAREIVGLGDVPPHFLDEVRHFFSVYKDLEGKVVTTLGWEDRAVAERLVLEAMERYETAR